MVALPQPTARRHKLVRLFPAFPRGFPGLGLLLLRLAIGIVACAEGVEYLVDPAGVRFGSGALASVAILCGILLVTGFLTLFAGVVVTVGIVGIAFSLLPQPPGSVLGALPAALAGVMSAAIVLLGPGAFSLDARLYGRREIIIPPASRSDR